MNRKRLGEVLVERGLLSAAELDAALTSEHGRSERLAEVLARNTTVSKAELGSALEAVNQMPYIDCPPEEIPTEVLTLIPGKLAARSCTLPVALEEGRLIVAMGEPQNLGVLEDLEFASGFTIEPRFSFRGDVVEGIRRFYGTTPPPPGPPVDTTRPPETHVGHIPQPSKTPARAHLRGAAVVVLIVGSTFAAVVGWQAAVLTQRTLSGLSELIAPAQSGGAAPLSEPAAPGSNTRMMTLATPERPVPAPYRAPDATVPDAGPANPEPPHAVAGGTAPAPEHPSKVQDEHFQTTVQVGVFRDRTNAERLAADINRQQPNVTVSTRPDGLFAVEVGPLSDKPSADRVASEIAAGTGLTPLIRQVRR